MATFRFNLQRPYENTPDGKKPSKKPTRIYLFIIHDRDNVGKIKTEYTVKPTDWNFEEKKLKHQVTGAAAINRNLTTMILSVEDEYNNIRKDYPEMKFAEIMINLKTFVKTKSSPVYSEANKSLFDVLDEYMENRMDDVSALTIKKYLSLKKSLREFDPLLSFDNINLKFFDRYIRHLRTKKPSGRQKTRAEGSQTGLLDDTVSKYIETLKNLLKWSHERGYHTNDIYKHSGFAVKRKAKHEIVTLHLDELKHFYAFDFSDSPRLERVRDIFCFACFTGQRWSDIERFDKKDLDGDVWQFESYKTKKKISVPLIGYSAPALDILRKYDNELPKITPQKFNLFLKEAGKVAGLGRPVQLKRFIGKKEIITAKPLYAFMASHMARRTCVSLLLNVEGMPLHLVREITGHSDLKTLDKYLDKDFSALRKEMNKTRGVNNLTIVKDQNKNAV